MVHWEKRFTNSTILASEGNDILSASSFEIINSVCFGVILASVYLYNQSLMLSCRHFGKLQAVVLDPGLDDDLVSDVQKYLEDLLNSGLRQRLISLIKVLNSHHAIIYQYAYSMRMLLHAVFIIS